MLKEPTMRDIILRIVNSSQGVNGVKLVIEVMSEIGPTRLDHDEYIECLESLVKNREIVEVEYTLPHMDFRVKSLYLPKGTTISIKK